MKKNGKCLVVDGSYMARSIISTERAFVIKYKGNAEIVAEYDDYFGLVSDLKIKKPSIIRVPTYINLDFHKVPLTKQNVFKRDEYKCVYCESSDRKSLTIDHVIPQSKGGPNTWGNLVTACFDCNNEKDNLTLKEYGKEIPTPTRPHYLMLMKNIGDIPKEWKPFLFL